MGVWKATTAFRRSDVQQAFFESDGPRSRRGEIIIFVSGKRIKDYTIEKIV